MRENAHTNRSCDTGRRKIAFRLDQTRRTDWGLSKILCTRVPGRRLSIYPETP